MLRNMVTELLEKERIITTIAKAKELRPFAEKMITLGKRENSTLVVGRCQSSAGNRSYTSCLTH